jgi:hypothetical protein
MSKIGDSFLWTCKSVYFEDIHPFDFDKGESEGYKRVIDLGLKLIAEDGIQDFMGFMLEYQYRVKIWAAFIALEYGIPSATETFNLSSKKETIVEHCLSVISQKEIKELNDSRSAYKKQWINKIKTHYKTNEQEASGK